jgi:flavin reductase (DIM6/NTAB) family NADH-FMN oxidoreductase RutF
VDTPHSRLGEWKPDPDRSAMRRTMGRWLTGVAVITTVDSAGVRHGGTISSLQSISYEPPILMFALNRGTRTGDALRQSGKFGVSILGTKQEAVARGFAVPGGTRFDDGKFEDSPDGTLPVVQGALAQAVCSVHSHQEVGDHDMFFGLVAAARHRSGQPLAFLSGHFGDFRDFGHEELPWWF